jgi:glyoxylase-like metal-dependent hydrolase (beta-lactamase superfamily II)
MKKMGAWDYRRVSQILSGLAAFLLPMIPGFGQDAQLTAQRPNAPEDFSQNVSIQHVQGRMYLLSGAGANITVQIGDEAIVLVDAGRADMSAEVLRAVRQLSNRPIEFVIDTSADADHVGGNENLSKAGYYNSGQPGERPGAGIASQLNVLNRLSDAKAPAAALPTDTYGNSWSFFNDEAIVLYHAPEAHTDGDSYVFFRRSDVISTGDLFVPSVYPVIETEKGGSIDGIIDGLNDIIGLMVPRENEEGGTYLIPGHGRICDRTDIVNYRDALTIIRARIQDLVSKGRTLEQVKATRPTFDYDGLYGSERGPWTTDMFIEAIYHGLSKSKVPQNQKGSGR